MEFAPPAVRTETIGQCVFGIIDRSQKLVNHLLREPSEKQAGWPEDKP